MRIVLDARKYYDFGIGTYIQNLAQFIGSKCDLTLIISPQDAANIRLPSPIKTIINKSGKYSLAELFSIAGDANRLKADLFHSPHYTTPFGLKMPCVTTIHDILHVRSREYYPLPKRMYARTVVLHACRSSSAVLVDSEFTKQEILNIFNIDENRIHVIHLGISSVFSSDYPADSIEEFRKEYGLVKPTIFYTGSLKPHKNVDTLIRAFSRLKNRKDFQLAFSGELITEEKRLYSLIKEQNIQESIVEIGQISGTKLPLAYRAASVVVLPSFYEGFGFSVLEAMASGIPAIGSRAGSIPEVMGDGGLLFDPNSAEDLTAAMEKVLYDNEFRTKLVQKGYRNAARFSWEKCSEQTLQIYRDIL
jgi:glycosyltransferase involved in cell wall biosynthesis